MCPLAKSSAASLVQGCARMHFRSSLGSLYFVSPSNPDRSCQSTTQPVRDSLESEDVLVDLNFSWRVPRLDIAGHKIAQFFLAKLPIKISLIFRYQPSTVMWIFRDIVWWCGSSLCQWLRCALQVAVLTRLCFVFFVKIGLTVPVGSRQEEHSRSSSPR